MNRARLAVPACFAVLLAAMLGTVPPAAAEHTAAPSAVSVPGSHNSEMGCPGDWQPQCAHAQLTRDPTDDVWKGTFTLPPSSYEYKAALNMSWDENYGAGAVPNGSSIAYTSAGGPTAFYYDHGTHWITSDAEGPIVTAPGDFLSELGCPGDWMPECMRSWLQDPDNDGVYTFSTTAIPAGAYEVKVAHGLSWNENYGAGGAAGGQNIAFSVAANGDRTTFTYVLATHVLSVSAGTVSPAPAAPTVTLTDPVNAANGGTATVSGTGQAGTTANISVDDTEPATAAVTATVPVGTGGYNATVDLTSLDDGTLTATVTLTDAAGNTGPEGTDTAIKDTVAPAAPTVSLTEPVTPANVDTVRVSGTGEVGTTANISVDDTNPATPAVTGMVPVGPRGYGATLDLRSLDQGALTASVTLTDGAGNTGPHAIDTSRRVGPPSGRPCGPPCAPPHAGGPPGRG